MRPKVEKELDNLVKSEVLEPVCQCLGYPYCASPKKNGTIRICGDFKVTVNPALQNEQYSLPLIDDLFAGLSQSTQFSKIDLNQAYLQMLVDQVSRELLAISTHKGLFRYHCLAFGVTSAPASFQKDSKSTS